MGRNQSPPPSRKHARKWRACLGRRVYRQEGKVRKRTIANLTHYPPEDTAAIELALKHKHDLAALGSIRGLRLRQGLSVGAVWVVYQLAKRLGLEKALGSDFSGQLALWQVIARVIDQGSRLSAVRLAQVHAACDVLGVRRGFDGNDLYDNLAWQCGQQEAIERRLFAARRSHRKPELFLYDVTSSYLEGRCNQLGAYGYNRDGQKGWSSSRRWVRSRFTLQMGAAAFESPNPPEHPKLYSRPWTYNSPTLSRTPRSV